MDSDLWISRLAAAKRHCSMQHQQNLPSDRFGMDEFEVDEDDVRSNFPCPFCYDDHDITSLCSHLEEEHAFESTAAVCPICSLKVTRDMLNHITLQHGHIFKMQRCRRLRRFALPSSQALSLLGRDLREAHFQLLLGSSGYRSNNIDESNSASDSLISSLLLNLPTSEAEEISKPSIEDNSYRKRESHLPSSKSSFNSTLTYEQKEQRRRQATIRATFVQDLLLSTLFCD